MPDAAFPAPALVAEAEPVARAAAEQIAPAGAIGELVAVVDEGDRVFTLLFDSLLAGYPGWRWAVSVAALEASPLSVLETELVPGDDSLLAPDWVPWAERLADWEAAQAALAEAATDDDAEDEDAGDEDEDDAEDEDRDDDAEDDADDDDADDAGAHDEHDLHDDLDDHIDDDLVQQLLQDDAADPRDSTVPVDTGALSAVAAVGVDEPDESEKDAGGAGAEQQVTRRRGKRRRKQDAGHEGEHPEH